MTKSNSNTKSPIKKYRTDHCAYSQMSYGRCIAYCFWNIDSDTDCLSAKTCTSKIIAESREQTLSKSLKL